MDSDAEAAAVYDLLNPWGPSDDFYLSYVMEAPSVLDVGCGTGVLLHQGARLGDPDGRELRIIYNVESVVDDVVTFTETTATRDGEPLRVDRASLRFLDVKGLANMLGGAGFEVEAWYGDWSLGLLTDASDNIVVVANAARGHGR